MTISRLAISLCLYWPILLVPVFSSGQHQEAVDDGTHHHHQDALPKDPVFLEQKQHRAGVKRYLNRPHSHAETTIIHAAISASSTSGGDYILPELFVQDFGAKADGSDDTAAFQRALAAAKQGGNAVVHVPAGTYAIFGHLVVPPHTALKGVNAGPYSKEGDEERREIVGTTLQAYEGAHCNQNGNDNDDAACDEYDPFIHLEGPNAAIRGMSIVYPEQANSTASTPISYPWCVRGTGDNVLIQNMFLLNPYLGIDFGKTKPAGRHLIDNVHGNPLKIGIFVDQTYDVGRIRHVHFWNFWAGRNQNGKGPVTKLQQWVSAHGITLQLARTDWEVVDDIFSWGYHTGALLIESTHIDPKTNTSIGAMNGQFTNIQFDAVNVGIDIAQTNEHGVFFSNLNLANAGWGDQRVGIWARPQSTGSNVVVRGASFWGAWYQAVQWDSQASFSISDSTIVEWDKSNNENVALMNFTAGGIRVCSCAFGRDLAVVQQLQEETTTTPKRLAIHASGGVQRLIVTANDFLGMAVESNAVNAVIESNLV